MLFKDVIEEISLLNYLSKNNFSGYVVLLDTENYKSDLINLGIQAVSAKEINTVSEGDSLIIFGNSFDEEINYSDKLNDYDSFCFHSLFLNIINGCALNNLLKNESPKDGIIVFSLPRSGSTLLSELLQLNNFGDCKEHLRDPFIFITRHYKLSITESLNILANNSTSKVFATKFISHFLFNFIDYYTNGLSELVNWINNKKYTVIYLERRFKPAQAVSEYFAQKTNIYHSFQVKESKAHPVIEYDFDQIFKWFTFLMDEESKLKAIITELKSNLYFTYHDVSNLQVSVINEISSAVTSRVSNVEPNINTRIKKLKRDNAQKFIARFKKEINWN